MIWKLFAQIGGDYVAPHKDIDHPNQSDTSTQLQLYTIQLTMDLQHLSVL